MRLFEPELFHAFGKIEVSVIETAYYWLVKFNSSYADGDEVIGSKAFAYGDILEPRLDFSSEEHICRGRNLVDIRHDIAFLNVREVVLGAGLKTEEIVGPIAFLRPMMHVCSKLFRRYLTAELKMFSNAPFLPF